MQNCVHLPKLNREISREKMTRSQEKGVFCVQHTPGERFFQYVLGGPNIFSRDPWKLKKWKKSHRKHNAQIHFQFNNCTIVTTSPPPPPPSPPQKKNNENSLVQLDIHFSSHRSSLSMSHAIPVILGCPRKLGSKVSFSR